MDVKLTLDIEIAGFMGHTVELSFLKYKQFGESTVSF